MAYAGERSTFGKYFLIKKLATGGMGEIFLAKLTGPEEFERLVVIKRILEEHIENEDFLDMFFAEARIVGQLSHSNIVQVYEMGRIDSAFFISMEYVHGKTLRTVLDRSESFKRPLLPAMVIDIIARVCDGMSYAHNAKSIAQEALGIIHRDLTPHNLLISYGGDVKIIDFGIAKSEMRRTKTESGTIKGKFVYMSPEQSAAKPIDKRSDIFSIGICLYELLAGDNPFIKDNVVLSLDAIQRQNPPPLAKIRPEYAAFDPIIRKALAKNPDQRYNDCGELATDLRGLLTSGQIKATHQTLAGLMHDLFPSEIDEEARAIARARMSTEQLASVDRARERDLRGWRWLTSTIVHARVRWGFWTLMSLMLTSTAFGVVAIKTFVPPAGPAAQDEAPPAPSTEEPKLAQAQPPEPRPDEEPPRGADPEPEKEQPPPAEEVAQAEQAPPPEPKPEPEPEPAEERQEVAVAPKPKDSPRDPSPRPRPSDKPAPKKPPRELWEAKLSVSVFPPMPPNRIWHDGEVLGTKRITIKPTNPRGKIQVGGPGDPYRLTIRYETDGKKVQYSFDATPRASIADKNDRGFGNTPVRNVSGSIFVVKYGRANFEQRVTLNFSVRK